MAYGQHFVQPPYVRATQSKSLVPRYAFSDDWGKITTLLVNAPSMHGRYKYILSFTAPDALVALANLGRLRPAMNRQGIKVREAIELQGIQDSLGDYVNIDYYYAEFTLQDASATADMKRLLNWFRLNINLFLRARVVSRDKRIFVPHSKNEEAIWSKQDPTGAIIDIEPGWVGMFFDDMTVLVSDFCSQQSLEAYWIFSTIWSSWNNFHPVSGNRLFGLERVSADKNLFRFYTSGIDGLADTSGPDAFYDRFVDRFEKGDEFWRTLFTNLEEGLKRGVDNKAEFKTPVRATAEKKKMDEFFKTAVFSK